jgi:GNAT superfamily N-acetyltransferase
MAPRVCGVDEVPTAVEILCSAFYDDPTWSWVFPDPEHRAGQHRLLWQAFVDGAMRYQTVWLNPDSTSVAVWVPPGGSEMSDEQEAALAAALERLLGPEASRVFEIFAAFEAAHPHHEPHFMLSLLGTHAAHRGHGYGLRLLAETLTVVDASGMPAYLEASNPANVALYARYGFEVWGSFVLPDDGPEVTTMWRPRHPPVSG